MRPKRISQHLSFASRFVHSSLNERFLTTQRVSTRFISKELAGRPNLSSIDFSSIKNKEDLEALVWKQGARPGFF